MEDESAINTPAVPSAADLDAVAAEQGVSEQTAAGIDTANLDLVGLVELVNSHSSVIMALLQEIKGLKARLEAYNVGAPHKI